MPRLFGFELLMAPYAMAHLKLGMQAGRRQDLPAERQGTWAYRFEDDERLGVVPDQLAGTGGTTNADHVRPPAPPSPTRPTPPPKSSATCPSWWSSATHPTLAIPPTRANGLPTWSTITKPSTNSPSASAIPSGMQDDYVEVYPVRPVAHPAKQSRHPGLYHQSRLSGQPDLSRNCASNCWIPSPTSTCWTCMATLTKGSERPEGGR